MQFDPERVQQNVREATTEDLLDRVTVYRNGMEPEALEIIEGELQDRGILRDRIRAYAAQREQEVLRAEDGTAIACSFCYRPAVVGAWGWHWLSLMIWGKRRALFPILPRYYHYCQQHRPPEPPADDGPESVEPDVRPPK